MLYCVGIAALGSPFERRSMRSWSSTAMNHEKELIKAFITPTKSQRYLDFVSKPKTRQKFLRELAHFKSLDPRYAKAVHVSPAGLAALLKQKGVPDTCWVISENREIDGKSMPTSNALAELGGTWVRSFPSFPVNSHTSKTKMGIGYWSTLRLATDHWPLTPCRKPYSNASSTPSQ